MDPKLIKQWKEIGSLYEILGLKDHTSSHKIKKAYKLKALEFHPDKNPDPNAREMFEKIKKASDILMDPIQKEQYDKYLDSLKYHKDKIASTNVERSKHISELAQREKAVELKKEEQKRRAMEKEQIKRVEIERVKKEMEDDALRKREEGEKRKLLENKSKTYTAIQVKWKSGLGQEYNDDLLKIIFCKYGEIKGVAMIPGESKAVVEFVHRLSAEKAYKENRQQAKEEMGFADPLKVKLMFKEEKNKKLKTEQASKPNDFSLSSSNLEKISHLFNRNATDFMASKEDEMRKMSERSRLMQEMLAEEGIKY